MSVWCGLLFLSLSFYVQAQNQNVCQNRGAAALGNFTLDKSRVCQDQPVNIVSVPSNLSSVSYTYEYNGSGIPSGSGQLTYTYSKPGSYTILQTSSSQGTATIACREVEVLPIEPVKFEVRVCSGRKVVLNIIDAGQYDNYTVNWGDNTSTGAISRAFLTSQPTHIYSANLTNIYVSIVGNYSGQANCQGQLGRELVRSVGTPIGAQPAITRLSSSADAVAIQYQGVTGGTALLESRSPGGTWTTTGQSTSLATGQFTVPGDTKQVSCFRLTVQDGCGSEPRTSDEVCSLVLNATAANRQNDLSWQPYAGQLGASQFRFYRLSRNGAPLTNLNRQSLNGYADRDRIECGVPYCYTLEAVINASVETVVTSAPVCVTGQNGETPAEPRALLADVLDDGQVRVQAVFPPQGSPGVTGQYTALFSRADSPTGTFQSLQSVSTNVLIDATANTSAQSYCYRVVYRNGCGLESAPSQPVCTIWLGSQSGGLDWTADSPFWPGDVSDYIVEVVDGSEPAQFVGNANQYDPDPNGKSPQRYRIIATNSANGLTSHSNVFEYRRQVRLLVPDAFTPNGDGLNETFDVKGAPDQNFRLTIYGRWGEVLYNTTDPTQGWNGQVNGQPAQTGQYTYRIEVGDQAGQKTVRTGALLLVR